MSTVFIYFPPSPNSSYVPPLPLKIMTTSCLIIIISYLCIGIYKYSLLSSFSIVHMCMCLIMTTWNLIT